MAMTHLENKSFTEGIFFFYRLSFPQIFLRPLGKEMQRPSVSKELLAF